MSYSIADLKASCKVVTAEETEDIAKAIKFARSQGLPIAVRGGGHSSSTASATEGLLIDLRKLNNIRVDEDAKVGYIQPGALVCDIEIETIKYGLGACVGICNQVSIGGYTVGGGIGYSTGAHGLAADNLISATVVLANGEIVEASEMENADLLWGIRGGGSNFGVLAELRVKLHSQRPDAYAVSYAYPPSRINEVVEEINRWRQVQKLHETVFMLIQLGPDKQPYVLVNGLSNSTQEEGEAAFKRFLDLGPVKTINVQIPWKEACNLANDISIIADGKLFCGAHIDVFDAAQAQKSFDAWQEMVKKAPSSVLMYEFYHYGKVAERPLGSAAFAQRHELITVLCACMEFGDDYAPYVQDDLLKLKKIVAASSSKAAQESLGYSNYGDLYCTLNDTDEYTKKIFGSNYPRLQEIKKKYDPDMVNSTAAQVPRAEVCKITDSLNVVPGGKIFVGAHIDKFNAEQVQKRYDAWQEVIREAPFSVVMYEFFDYGNLASVPLEGAAFAQRYDFQTVQCAMMGMEDDYILYAWDDLLKLRGVVSSSSSQAARETLGYANYSDPFCTQNDTEQYARKHFGTNYARLQEVKKKYDPDVAVDRWFTLRPAA